MTVTDPQLRSAAALLAAVPDLVCRIDTAAGDRIVAGDAPEAAWTAQAFRDLVSSHAIAEPTSLAISGVDAATGLASRPGERWFVSPLPAPATVACLRAHRSVSSPFHAMVRGDDDFAVAVVRIGCTDPASAHALDDVAVAAFAACLVDHLLTTTHDV